MNFTTRLIWSTVVLCLGASLLYSLSSNSQINESSKYIQNLLDIKQLNLLSTQWSRSVITTYHNPESGFDRLIESLPEIRQVRRRLENSELNDMSLSSDLYNKLQQFFHYLDNQEVAVERFKTLSAASRNSVNYLPRAYDLALAYYERRGDSKAIEEIVLFYQQLNEFLDNPDQSEMHRLATELAQLKYQQEISGFTYLNPAAAFFSHAEVVIKRIIPIENAISTIMNKDVGRSGERLISAYQMLEEQRKNIGYETNTNSRYLQIAIAATLILLALITTQLMGRQRFAVETNH